MKPLITVSLFLIFTLPIAIAQAIHGQATLTVTNNAVVWGTTFQAISGFGTSISYTADLTSAQADLLFTTSSGIGLSIARGVIASDNPITGCPSSCANPTDVQNHASLSLAQARGATVFLVPFSPPGAWKSNGSPDNGGSLLAANFANYAGYLKNYADYLGSTFGITVYGVSVQNEPDQVQSYETCVWTDQQLHDFIVNNMAPTFGSTYKILMPEPSGWDGLPGFYDTCVADSTCLNDVAVFNVHDYDLASDPQDGHGKPIWMTEIADGGPFDPSMTSGMTYAQQIHNLLTQGNASAWMYYEALDFGTNTNFCLICNGSATKRLYTLGNFSKWARPGYLRMQVTANFPGVLISAYRTASSTGPFSIVAINTNSTNTPISLSYSGFTASAGTTPNITDATRNLSADVVQSGSSGFTYTLPANSVVTFTGSNP